MKIVSVYFDDGAFLIVTTGARFEYAAGELKIYQGLGSDVDRRLVATMTIGDVNEFEKVKSNDDHVLFWSEKVNIGIYGDSKYQTLYPANLWSIRSIKRSIRRIYGAFEVSNALFEEHIEHSKYQTPYPANLWSIRSIKRSGRRVKTLCSR
jgi:hypothetical protein